MSRQFTPGRSDRCFRGPIAIDYASRGSGPGPHQFRRTDLTPQIDQADGGQRVIDGQQQTGHGAPYRHPIFMKYSRHLIHAFCEPFRSDEQGCAGVEGRPHFLDRNIEGKGCTGVDDIVSGESEYFAFRPYLKSDIAVAYHYAFGMPGRSGSVNDIGEIIAIKAWERRCFSRGCDVPQVRVNGDNGGTRRDKVHAARLFGDNSRRPAITRHVIGAFVRYGPVQRNISGPCHQAAQQHHVLIHAARQANNDPISALDALRLQIARKVLRALAQLTVC